MARDHRPTQRESTQHTAAERRAKRGVRRTLLWSLRLTESDRELRLGAPRAMDRDEFVYVV